MTVLKTDLDLAADAVISDPNAPNNLAVVDRKYLKSVDVTAAAIAAGTITTSKLPQKAAVIPNETPD